MSHSKNTFIYDIEDLKGNILVKGIPYREVLSFCGICSFNINSGNSRIIKEKFKVVKYSKFNDPVMAMYTTIPKTMWDEWDRVRKEALRLFIKNKHGY